MGDYANYLVPERYRIDAPEREDMERRMIGWMQKNGWLKLGKESDHPKILSKGGGWSVTARGSRHMHPPAYHKEKVDGYAQWMRAQGELTGPADRPQLTPKGMVRVYGTGGPDAVSRPFSVEAWLEEQGVFGGVAVEVITEGKGLFPCDGGEPGEVICPKCGADVAEHFMEMVETWYSADAPNAVPLPRSGTTRWTCPGASARSPLPSGIPSAICRRSLWTSSPPNWGNLSAASTSRYRVFLSRKCAARRECRRPP